MFCCVSCDLLCFLCFAVFLVFCCVSCDLLCFLCFSVFLVFFCVSSRCCGMTSRAKKNPPITPPPPLEGSAVLDSTLEYAIPTREMQWIGNVNNTIANSRNVLLS